MQEHRPFLPHGFQFRPSDEELIEHYLKKKVSGIFIPLAEYFIRDCNLYETKPSEIWDSHGGAFLNADEDLYFFTQLKKKSSKDSRIDRKVGSSGGTWQGEDAGKDIVSGQSKIKIGSKKRFRYEKQGCEDHGAWIMHEYTLHLPKNQATNYTLCRLRKNQPTGHDIRKYGSAKKRKLKDFQDSSNQSEQVADIEMDRLLTHQQIQQQNYMDYQEVSCNSTCMMSEQRLAGGMGVASSVTEQHSGVDDQIQQQQGWQISVQNLECHYKPSMEMTMSHFDQMICHQHCDSGNNMLQSRQTGENYHCHSESIVEVPMAVPESLRRQENSDVLPELMVEDYSFAEELLVDDAESPIGNGQSIDCQITSSMVDVPNKEADGTDHSSGVAEQQFQAFIAVLDQTVESSSLQENQHQRECQYEVAFANTPEKISTDQQCDYGSGILLRRESGEVDYELEQIHQLLLADQNDGDLAVDLDDIWL